jgi:hypothetical protein
MSGSAKHRGRRAGSAAPPHIPEEPEQTPDEAQSQPGESPASPGRGESDNTMHETPAMRHARLKALILERRRQKEILAIEKELAGDDPAYRADIVGESQGHKRAVSFTAETQPIRATFNRPKTPPIFSGKDIAELDNFDVGFKAYFKAVGLQNAQEQIKLAVTYLESNPQKAWFRREKPEPPTMT